MVEEAETPLKPEKPENEPEKPENEPEKPENEPEKPENRNSDSRSDGDPLAHYTDDALGPV